MTEEFVVCPDCRGKGTKDNYGAFGRDDLDEWFGGDRDGEDAFLISYKDGQFDVQCSFCKGRRVVTKERLDEWEDEINYRLEIEAERRVGA